MTPSKPYRSSRRAPADPDERETPRPDPRPGTITSLKAQVRDPERMSVFVDGTFSFGVALTVAEEHGLSTGQVLDAAKLATVLAAESLHKATSTALNFLGYRPRSEGEIRTRLRKGSYPDETIEVVLDRLRGWGYVDDEDFARRWVENRATHRPRGSRLLANELRAKGIDGDLGKNVIEEASIDESADALALARDRMRQLGDLERDVRERRLGGFLTRRGYGYDVIRPVLQQIRAECDHVGNDEIDLGDGANVVQ